MGFKRITYSIAPDSCGNEYSVNPFSYDNSYLILLRSNLPSILDHFGLFDGSGKFLRNLPITANEEPRFSLIDAKKLSFTRGNTFMGMNVESGAVWVEYTFTEYVSLKNYGESDISDDSEHFVLAGVKKNGTIKVFTYSTTEGKGPVYPQTLPIDGLKITRISNEIILSRNSDPHKPTDGIFILTPNGERRLTDADEHACVATYKGRDVLLWAESDTENACVMIDVETGARTTLALQLPWDYAIHISAPRDLPWCVVSTDCPDHKLPAQVWKVYYDNKIPSELICEPDSVFTGYSSEVMAAVPPDGTKIVGRSNFGKTDNPDYCDVWMVDLPPTQPSPDPDPIVETDSYGEKWENRGSLPFEAGKDLLDFNAEAKSITVYRRK